MNQYDLAGILQTAAALVMTCSNTEGMRNIVRDLKRELNADAIKHFEKTSHGHDDGGQ